MVSYAHQSETSPSLGVAFRETVATFVGSWEVQRSGVLRISEWDLAVPGGLRSAKLRPLSWAPGRSSALVSYAHQNETSPSLGGCDPRNCRHFRGLLGGPAQWCLTHIRMGPRRPGGVRSVKLSLLSWAPGRSGAEVSYAYQSGTSPSPGCCDPQNYRHFRELLGGPTQWCPRQIRMRPRRPWGTAKLRSATFVGSWEAQRSGDSFAAQNGTSPSLGGLRFAKLFTSAFALRMRRSRDIAPSMANHNEEAGLVGQGARGGGISWALQTRKHFLLTPPHAPMPIHSWLGMSTPVPPVKL